MTMLDRSSSLPHPAVRRLLTKTVALGGLLASIAWLLAGSAAWAEEAVPAEPVPEKKSAFQSLKKALADAISDKTPEPAEDEKANDTEEAEAKKDPPSEEPAEEEQAEAEPPALEDIPASEFTKRIRNSTSPNKKWAVAVGSPDGSAPEWQKVPIDDETFTMETGDARNYLVDLKRNRITGMLDGRHFGTGTRYNHENVHHSWSSDSRWLAETVSWKWVTATCTIHRLNPDGSLAGRVDLIQKAMKIVNRRLMKRGVEIGEDGSSEYTIRMSEVMIANNGVFTARILAEIPKDMHAQPLSLMATGTVVETGDGSLGVKWTSVKKVR